MNVTLSIDEKVVARARSVARRRGTSLNQIIRDYLASLASPYDTETAVAELERLWADHEGSSRGWKWNRDEVHDRPILR